MNQTTSLPEDLPTLEEVAARFDIPEHAQATIWAANVLRTAMNDGALTPGTKLSEIHIAELLGISRNTLRQAFIMLVAQNLVEQIPNRGVFVKEPDARQIQEMFAVRLALESTAIELCPAEADLSRLRAAVKQSKESRARGSVAGMARANNEFHGAIVALAGNQRMNRMMSSILAEMRLLFFSQVNVPSFHANFVDLNEELLRLIETRNLGQAQRKLRMYLLHSRAHSSAHLSTELTNR